MALFTGFPSTSVFTVLRLNLLLPGAFFSFLKLMTQTEFDDEVEKTVTDGYSSQASDFQALGELVDFFLRSL